MKFLHIVALVCFALAFVFYLAPWPQGALGLGLFGFVFEALAWVAFFTSERAGSSELPSAPVPFEQTTQQPLHHDRDGP